MKIRKILFISEHGDPLAELGGGQAGGQNNYVKHLANYLSDRGLIIDIVTHWSNENAPQIEYFGKRCRVIRIAAGRKGFVPKAEIVNLLDNFYDEMKLLLNLYEYDVIHSHYWMSGLLGLALKEEFDIPLVHTSHSLGIAKEEVTEEREEKRLKAERKILRNANCVIATTPNEKEIIKNFAGKQSVVSVISIGVDKAFEKTTFQKPPLNPLFVYAGRFEENKGILTLLEAFKYFVKEEPEGRLILAGGLKEDIDLETSLPIDTDLRHAVEGIEDRVTFLGSKSQPELASLFSKATAVVVPSYYESFGMVAAEAQACGTPVIASKIGGLQNVVQDGQTGILVPIEDSLTLAKTLKKLAENPYLAEKLGREAEKRACLLFSWSSIAKSVQDLYEVVYDEKNSIFVSDGS